VLAPPRLCLLLLVPLLMAGCYEGWGGVGDDDSSVFPDLDDDDSADDDDLLDDDDDDDDDDGPDPCSDPVPSESMPVDEECRVDLEITEDPNLEIVWQYSDFAEEPCHREVMMTPLVVPLTDDDGDGAPSAGDQRAVIFISWCGSNYGSDGILRALRGDGSDVLWSNTDPAWRIQPDSALAAGDIDGDGWPEIVAVHDSHRLAAFDRFGDGLWISDTSVPGGAERGGAFLSDMDGDGAVEIVYANQIYDSDGVLLATGPHGTGANASRPEFPTSFTVDIDLDGDQEVVVGNALYDMQGVALMSNAQPDGFPAVANFDSDPEGEVVVVFSNQVRIQDTNGAILFGPVTLPGSGAGGPPTVADFDGDGWPEIGVANLAYYTMLDSDLTQMWSNETTDVSSAITGSSAFDFDADGASEVVYSDEHDVWVWDGTSGDLIHRGEGHASGTHLEYPVVAQVLDDGPPQIVVGSNNLSSAGWTGITLLSDSGRAWVPTRALWNQHAFMPTHIGDDLSIPAAPDNPWLVGQGFRQNEVVTVPGVAAPDLQVELHAACMQQCPESIILRIRPLNSGIGAGATQLSLAREGDTEPFLVEELGAIPEGTRGAAVDITLDPADLTVPVTVSIDPAGAIAECDEDNNSIVIEPLTCP
jgi:hypothetical protein